MVTKGWGGSTLTSSPLGTTETVLFPTCSQLRPLDSCAPPTPCQQDKSEQMISTWESSAERLLSICMIGAWLPGMWPRYIGSGKRGQWYLLKGMMLIHQATLEQPLLAKTASPSFLGIPELWTPLQLSFSSVLESYLWEVLFFFLEKQILPSSVLTGWLACFHAKKRKHRIFDYRVLSDVLFRREPGRSSPGPSYLLTLTTCV